MEDVQQTQQQTRIAKIWPFVLLALGIYRVGDWFYSGRQDLPSLLAGIGFLLMAPGAFVLRQTAPRSAAPCNRWFYVSLTVIGLALVIAAIVYRWL